MPKFKTCEACGSAEMVNILARACPGCGTPYPLKTQPNELTHSSNCASKVGGECDCEER